MNEETISLILISSPFWGTMLCFVVATYYYNKNYYLETKNRNLELKIKYKELEK